MTPMQVMVLRAVGSPLQRTEVPIPAPDTEQVVVRVECCVVSRTDCASLTRSYASRSAL